MVTVRLFLRSHDGLMTREPRFTVPPADTSTPADQLAGRPDRLRLSDSFLVTVTVTVCVACARVEADRPTRSEEHTSELQSRQYIVCRLLLDKIWEDGLVLSI